MSYKLTTNGGLQLHRDRSIEQLQLHVLALRGKLPLYVRNLDEPDPVVLVIPKQGPITATRHCTPMPECTWPEWMSRLTRALNRTTAKEPSHV